MVNLNSLGAKAVKWRGTDLTSGAFSTGNLIIGIYRSSAGFVELITPPANAYVTSIPDDSIVFVKLASSAIASVADILAGTLSKIVTASNLLTALMNMLGFNKFYESSQLTISTGGMSVAHGLSSLKDWGAYLVCTSANLGYAVGDTVKLQASMDVASASSLYGGYVWVSSTHIGVTIPSTGITIFDKSNANYAIINGANWKIIFRAI